MGMNATTIDGLLPAPNVPMFLNFCCLITEHFSGPG